MVVVAFLVAGSLCLANGMEPFAFPFATQTVWQAGGNEAFTCERI
jgi:hypothetical protein